MQNVNTISTGIVGNPVPSVNPPGHSAAKAVDNPSGGGGKNVVELPNKEQLEKIIAEIKKTVSPLNIDLKFSCYGPNNQYLAVTVINKETGEVVREIPSAEMKKLYSRSKDLSGLILNNSI
jgi:uncharacterized FlaG/YvyC family protein